MSDGAGAVRSDQAVDVLIAGAGVMGAATAFWITRMQPRLRVVLVERAPDFAQASSSLSASSIRQQFSSPVNIALSQFGAQFLREADHWLGPGSQAELGFHEAGYLYLAEPAQEPALRALHAVQQSHGVEVALLEPEALARRFPWLRTDDISLGSLGLRGEGWFDGPGLHQRLLRCARQQGAELWHDEVLSLQVKSHRLQAVNLRQHGRLSPGLFINAAGAWSARLSPPEMPVLPIVAARRSVFVLSCPQPLAACPLLIDPSGFWLRPEGRYLITGREPIDDRPDLPLQPDWDEMDEGHWMRLAHRIPALEALRIERAWAGYYEMNRFDHNALIGPHPGLSGYAVICGFSGHGMQHAPAAGLALAQWLLDGQPHSVDVRPLGLQRWLDQQPLLEANVIG
jgi:glycine/D-amino acid oxidase-like deaminating enzyme